MMPTAEMIESHRARWAKTAKERGWHVEPFFVQIWYDVISGDVLDSVSHVGMKKDVLIGCNGRDHEGFLNEIEFH